VRGSVVAHKLAKVPQVTDILLAAYQIKVRSNCQSSRADKSRRSGGCDDVRQLLNYLKALNQNRHQCRASLSRLNHHGGCLNGSQLLRYRDYEPRESLSLNINAMGVSWPVKMQAHSHLRVWLWSRITGVFTPMQPNIILTRFTSLILLTAMQATRKAFATNFIRNQYSWVTREEILGNANGLRRTTQFKPLDYPNIGPANPIWFTTRN